MGDWGHNSSSSTPNLGNWGDKLSSPSIGQSAQNSGSGWKDVMNGLTGAATLVNTGLGLYSALKGPYKQTSNMMGGSLGASTNIQRQYEGNQTRPLGGLDSSKVTTPSGAGQGGSNLSGMQKSAYGDKHLDILRQLLGVYTG